MHIIIDGHSASQELMANVQYMKEFLVGLAHAADMTVFAEPIVVDYPWPKSDESALSAICFLGESGIMVHTYPEKNYIFLDLFSCKDFDVNRVFSFVKKAFILDAEKVLLLSRGVNARTGKCEPATVLWEYDKERDTQDFFERIAQVLDNRGGN